MSKMSQKAAQGNKNQPTRALAKPGKMNNEALAAAIQRLQAKGFETLEKTSNVVEEAGNLVEKELLVGRKHIIFYVERRLSERYFKKDGRAAEWCTVHAMLPTGEVVIYNDGSTGICAQLDGIEVSPENTWIVPKGLIRSDYPEKRMEDGTIRPAGTTYYLSGQRDTSEIKGLNPDNTPQRNGRQLRA